MSSYIIAGSADAKETAECEHISNTIKSFYKNIDFRIIIKHPNEWEEYIHEICRTYGFKCKHNPIIFTLDGHLIGDTEAYRQLALKTFGVNTENMTANPINEQINMKIVEKEVEKKKKILQNKKTLAEKIELSLKERYDNNTVKPTCGIYEKIINNGLQLYVKHETRLCPEIIIPKEQECNIVKEEVVDEELDVEAIRKKDFNFEVEVPEEEMSQHSKMLDNDSKLKDSKLRASQQEQMANVPDVADKILDEEVRSQEGEEKEKQQTQKTEESEQVEQWEHQMIEEPIWGKLINLKDYVIKRIKKDYYLALHPDPLIDGQCLCFEAYHGEHQKSEEELKESIQTEINIRDFSQQPRHRKYRSVKGKKVEVPKISIGSGCGKDPKKESGKQEIPAMIYKSFLNIDTIDIRKPLSGHDWNILQTMFQKIDSIIYFQILPWGKKQYMDLTSGCINVILRNFILEAANNQGIRFLLNRQIQQQIDYDIMLLPFEKYIMQYKGKVIKVGKNFIQIPSLEFQHVIKILKKNKDLKEKKIKRYYKSMVGHLVNDFSDRTSMGINCIVTKQFMMLVPLRKNYSEINGTPLFVSPLAFIGFLHFPVLKNIWPGTAYQVEDSQELIDILQISAEGQKRE